MKKGDLVMFYHSNEGKHVVGIAKVIKEHYQDPTTTDPNWVVVDLAPFKTLSRAVTLEEIKEDHKLQNIALVKQGRLSVMPLNNTEFDRIIEISED
jgi:predicted RNA-binding protein with PUA-like domain